MTHPNPSSAPEGVIPEDVKALATKYASGIPHGAGHAIIRDLMIGLVMADRSSRAEGVGAEQLQKAWHATEARRSDIQGFYRRDDNSHYIRDLGLRRGEDVLWSESGEYEPTHAAMMERIELEQFRIVSASLSAIVPAPVRDEWRDIASAPRDGTKFDAWAVGPQGGSCRFTDVQMRGDNSGFGVVINHADGPHWEYLESDGPIYPVWILTHWRPLPASPGDAA